MKIAFTAPMKPLDHPQPSGDRTMGRLIVRALEKAGHDVTIASRFRAWRKHGGIKALKDVKTAALEEAERVAEDWQSTGYRPDAFLTYHLYHKAPDWIGPALSNRFDLPYAVIEASRAPKRRTGDWAFGFEAADAALKRADAVAAIHNADKACLREVVRESHLDVVLPFVDAAPYQAAADTPKPLAASPLKLMTAGMMREGDKTASYEVLAGALQNLMDQPWHLTIIGDGPNRDHILSLFPPERITFEGEVRPDRMPAHYARHDLFVWPAIREAFGLVFLEAQAAGLGVIAGDTFGVPDIVRNGETGLLSAEGNAHAFAANLLKILTEPSRADELGHAARRHVEKHHTLEAGAERINALLARACQNHRNSQTVQRS